MTRNVDKLTENSNARGKNDRETLIRPNSTATDDRLPSLPAGEPTSLAR